MYDSSFCVPWCTLGCGGPGRRWVGKGGGYTAVWLFFGMSGNAWEWINAFDSGMLMVVLVQIICRKGLVFFQDPRVECWSASTDCREGLLIAVAERTRILLAERRGQTVLRTSKRTPPDGGRGTWEQQEKTGLSSMQQTHRGGRGPERDWETRRGGHPQVRQQWTC